MDQKYKVATPIYQGPLDLLLKLIERAELDITKLALAQVTDQYLEHLHNLKDHDPGDVSNFLIIAAKLLQIKSEVLLPRPPVREEGEDDPVESLARQLKEYKRFKQISEFLDEREKNELRTYIRLVAPPKIEGKIDLTGFDLMEFILTARSLIAHTDTRHELKTVVAPPKVTIREKIRLITNKLQTYNRLSLQSLFKGAQSRLEIVVIFLALLELIKRHMVYVQQEHTFGLIELERVGDWEDDDNFELEFGE